MHLSQLLATLILAALPGLAPAPDAILELERKLASGEARGATYVNLGNAYAQQGRWAEATFAWRQAQLLLPADVQATANLAAARNVIARERDPAVTHEEATATGRWTALLYVVGGALFLAGSCLPQKPSRRAVGWLRRGLVAAGATLLVHVVLSTWGASGQTLAIVRQPRASLRTGNGTSYEVVTQDGVPVVLGLGQEVRLRHQRANGWYQVQLGNGIVGWLPEEAVVTTLLGKSRS